MIIERDDDKRHRVRNCTSRTPASAAHTRLAHWCPHCSARRVIKGVQEIKLIAKSAPWSPKYKLLRVASLLRLARPPEREWRIDG
ncbi:hypothetical protein E2C01_015614 [Portunus trituberculatus]|uniref:Uncharacterized protein n=1 Tax=Portunus trituberculatus TaxID=210409 RepID=A0A5B7DNA1_PORTR|nr:hypothetical protein [Portunus trituberculatus]